jgi:hyperosmotically inducible protein
MKTLSNVAAGIAVSILLLGAAGCASENHRGVSETGAIASDSWITTEVKSKLVADKQVSGTAIHVKTYEGVVTLSGKAKSQEEANRAVEDAKSIKGVKSVENNIEVASNS